MFSIGEKWYDMIYLCINMKLYAEMQEKISTIEKQRDVHIHFAKRANQLSRLKLWDFLKDEMIIKHTL